MEELVQRSMSAAEAGVRLQQLLCRHPDLLADQSGKMTTTGGGVGSNPADGSIPKRELLPLPLPRASLIRPDEIDAALPSSKVLGPKARKLGGQKHGTIF